jgi:hypothetical protein
MPATASSTRSWSNASRLVLLVRLVQLVLPEHGLLANQDCAPQVVVGVTAYNNRQYNAPPVSIAF